MKTKPVPFSQVPEGGLLSVTRAWVSCIKRGNTAVRDHENSRAFTECLPNTIVYVQL